MNIPQASIIEPDGTQLLALQLFPFFGAAKEDEIPGYMLIPDGSGALIRYGESAVQMSSPWRATVYGNNYGIGQGAAIQSNPGYSATMPIFGKVHGADGFLAIIENGDIYAEILAYTAGLITEFNWISPQFSYRYGYFMPTSLREDGPNIHRFQETANTFDITLRYRFLGDFANTNVEENGENSATYVGMALAYQDYLVQRGILGENSQNPQNLPNTPILRLEFFGGEIEQGLIFENYLAMTPIEDILEFAQTLQSQGVSDFLTVYRSFAAGGSNAPPNRLPLARQLGNAAATRNTITALANMNIPLFFSLDYSRAFVSGGFFGRGDLAIGANSQLINDGESFYLTPTAALMQASQDLRHLQNFGIQNIALETTATVLNSVFNEENEDNSTARQLGIDNLANILALINAENSPLAAYTPNSYAWQNVNLYFDIPMSSSRHLFATDTVPFLQTVLQGKIGYYTPFINLSSNIDLLTAIDFGAFPSFLLTSQPAHLLQETPSSGIYSSEFAVWEQTVISSYETIRQSLGQVQGQTVVNRKMLAPGVSQTTYSNGISIIVNYTSENFEEISPKSFAVR